MIKKFLALFLGIALVLTLSQSVYAKAVVKLTPTPKPSPVATPVPVVDSFELFWPMSAGKTMQSKVYFLKTLKEDVRGFLIFGSAQKADYSIFLGIKRMLEAEVLMKGNVPDLANKTLDSAAKDFDKANSSLTDAKNSGDVDQDTKNEINDRVSNLKKFVNSLLVQYPNYKDKLQSILDKLNSLTV